MSTGERKPVAPFYAVAALWLLSGALLPLYEPLHFAVLAAVSVVVFLLTGMLCRSGGTTGNAAASTAAASQTQTQTQTQPASAQESELDKVLRNGLESIAEMKRLNENIAAPDISADISRLELISGKIFQAVREDPSKLPQIHRFLDYYLPTTIKLLTSYDRMSNTGVSGENIDRSLSQIEAMIHNVVTAFSKQLDSLYGAEALDISADIKVLETMMAREGLKEPELKADAVQSDSTDIRLEL